MPVEVMADIAGMAGTPPKDMPPAMSRVATPVSVLTVDVLSILREPRVDTRVMQAAHIIGMAEATGEAAIGEAVTGIRRMDILGSAITAPAMAIHTSRVA